VNGASDFLFARPSFLGGMARVIDMGATLTEYNESMNGEQADLLALAMDYRAVGSDMGAALARNRQQVYRLRNQSRRRKRARR